MSKKWLPTLLLVLGFTFPLAFPVSIAAQTAACNADINEDKTVDLSDYSILIQNFLKNPPTVARSDINSDGLVDLSDYSLLIQSFLDTCETTPPPPPPPSGATEWTQDAGNAQRTGYISTDPGSNWTLAWTWNGPDANGGTGGHIYNAPKEARTVTGGHYVYAPAGANGVYALNKTNGQQAWRNTSATFNATPAYDPSTGYLFIGGSNGNLYKINTTNGSVAGTYAAGNALNKSTMIVGNYVYTVTDSGELHKVDKANMTRVWKYSGNGAIATPPAYSASRDIIIYATNDLYVHAVNNGSGSQKWRVKPTPNTAGFPNEFDGYWPVVAEVNGVVFVRMRINHSAGLWGGPGTGGMYPTTNAATRTFLQSNPSLKNLFALNLDNGSEKFIPAVGYGGTEDLVNGNAYLDLGPVPVVKTLTDGTEIAYQQFRSGDGAQYDGRWDSHLGEMVLNNNTISGMVAGDLRFVGLSSSQSSITDEQNPWTMAGNTLFFAHWGASEAHSISDRSSSKGSTSGNPITTVKRLATIRRMQACGTKNTTTHKTTCGGMTLFDDGRYWNGSGWWVYWDVLDPPTPHRGAYSEGILPRYTYVSDGLIIIEGNGGDLFVLKYQ